MKKLLLTLTLSISLLITGCSFQKAEETQMPTEEVTTQNQTTGEQNLIETMLADQKVLENIKKLCTDQDSDCPKDLFYTTKETNTNYEIAFLNKNSSENEKNNAFNYSPEIYQINKTTLEIFRRSPFAGNFDYLTTIK